MISRFLSALALLFGAAVAHAETPQWPEGVWRGEIGTIPVQACFERDGLDNLHGSYFYLKHLRPIALTNTTGFGFTEEGGAIWQLVAGQKDLIGGTWRNDRRSLPIRLSYVPFQSDEDWDSPCRSAEFMAPRLRPVQVTRSTPKQDGTLTYDELRYDVGPAFETVEISSFALHPQFPGDAAINDAVALDPLEKGSPADFADCIGGSIANFGIDGDFSLSLSPSSVRGEFLSVAASLGYYCGGAHPDNSIFYRTFDRRSGRELHLLGWLNEKASGSGEADHSSGSTTFELSTDLRSIVLEHFPRMDEDTDDCFGLVSETEYWTVALSSEGMQFEPSLPHVSQACGDVATVPFPRLGRFLSNEGTAGAARITSAPR